MRTIYTAPDADLAAAALDTFADGPWGERYPAIVASWRSARNQFAFVYGERFTAPVMS